MSNKLDLEIKQGQDELRLLTIKDDDGLPIDISAYSFRSSARESYNGKEVFEFSFSIKNQVTNKGEVEMTLSSSVTSLIKVVRAVYYIYDVEMIFNSNVTRIMQGRIYFDPEVTL